MDFTSLPHWRGKSIKPGTLIKEDFCTNIFLDITQLVCQICQTLLIIAYADPHHLQHLSLEGSHVSFYFSSILIFFALGC